MHHSRILICGNYGAGNFGDELILQGLLKALREIPRLDITVMSANPRETHETYGVHAVPHLPTHTRSRIRSIVTGQIFRTFAALIKSDLILFGGGCLFNETEPRSMEIWGRRCRFFELWRKKYFIIGQSFGEIKKEKHKKIIQRVASGAAKVMVRDHASKKRLEELKIHKKVHVLADSALWLDKEDLFLGASPDAIGQDSTGAQQYALINIRHWPSIDDERMKKIAETCAKTLKTRNVTPLSITLQRGENGDEALAKTLSEVHQFQKNTKSDMKEWQIAIAQGYASASLVISMRLHGAIAAIITETPVLFIPYDTKISDTFDDATFSSLKLDMDGTPQDWIDKTNAALDKAAEIHKTLHKFHVSAQNSLSVFKKMLTKNS